MLQNEMSVMDSIFMIDGESIIQKPTCDKYMGRLRIELSNFHSSFSTSEQKHHALNVE